MRVVAGDLRGRPIQAPDGPDTRPTSDRARQAVFNILEHASWADGLEGRRVLDLFAGSGAMGIEALSRGAQACLFVEQDEPACTSIRRNLSALKVEDRGRLLRRDATKLGARPLVEPAFHIAFLDPPYGQGLGLLALAGLLAGDWLAPDALVVLEQGAAEPTVAIEGLEQVDERRYGVARVRFFRRASASPQPAHPDDGPDPS